MKIKVKTVSGKEIILKLNKNTNVKELFEILKLNQDFKGVKKLVYKNGDKSINDGVGEDKTLQEVDIDGKETLFCVGCESEKSYGKTKSKD